MGQVEVDPTWNMEVGERVIELAGRVVDRIGGRTGGARAQPLRLAADKFVHRDSLAERVWPPPVVVALDTGGATRPDRFGMVGVPEASPYVDGMLPPA